MSIRLIIFDFDGTLGDTRDRIVGVMQHVLAEMHLPVADAASCAATIGLPLADCFRHLVPQLSPEGGERCAETYRRYFFSHSAELVPDLFPHVRTLLDALGRRGIVMAIASSRTSLSLKGFVQSMGIGDCFRQVVGCEDVVACKPAPEAVLHILEANSMHPDETLVVGDMPVDILMGKAAGCHTCGVTYGNASREQLFAADPDFLVDDPRQILSLI